jgi:subtilisin family serine protease
MGHWGGCACGCQPCGPAATQTHAPRRSSAVAAPSPSQGEQPYRQQAAGTCNILVIDTGVNPYVKPPESTSSTFSVSATEARMSLAGVDAASDADPWDDDKNRLLDPFSGHGTFIAGLLCRLAPGADVTVDGKMTSYGDTDDALLAQALMERFHDAANPPFDIVSMSFSGFTEDDDPPLALSEAIAHVQTKYRSPGDYETDDVVGDRVVFVAAAGNDSTCRPTWPATFESVISVGAIGPDGPAWFTNFGPWVQAAAPGVDIISTFFDLTAENARDDANDFDGWAQWSGTSFSAPIVAAEIAWEWMTRGSQGPIGNTASWLLQRKALYRYPWLGTVVNTC